MTIGLDALAIHVGLYKSFSVRHKLFVIYLDMTNFERKTIFMRGLR